MGCCCGTNAIRDEEKQHVLKEQDKKPTTQNILKEQDKKPTTQHTLKDQDKKPTKELPVSLEKPNVSNVQLPTIYYVIVGLGPMAVVNHRTLLESTEGRKRLGQHPVLHVGFANPWPKYLRHGLGQPNHLLSFPAFRNQPSENGETKDGGLDSQHFGRQVDAEFETLRAKVAKAWVALIQSRDVLEDKLDADIKKEIDGDEVYKKISGRIKDRWLAVKAPYRLFLVDPFELTADWVYAAAIDICTGPGRPNVISPRGTDFEELKKARTPPWLPPELWTKHSTWLDRRTLNGVDAIHDNVKWKAGDRICVTAGGGVGLNAAEKARENKCVLDWFGRSKLMDIFENPRNITFLREPNTNEARKLAPRKTVGILGEDDLIASHQLHRMGLGAVLASVADTKDAVEVELAPFGKENKIRDWWKKESALNKGGYWEFSEEYVKVVGSLKESRLYDRLVIPNGQDTEQVGQPIRIAGHLVFQEVVREKRLVALETADHLVRVLGAACNNYPKYDIGTWTEAKKPAVGSPANVMWTFHTTLPVSAVADGFIICGVNTALANDYFLDHANVNVNTMTYDELLLVVGKSLATTIVEERNGNNGYSNLPDLKKAIDLADVKNAILAVLGKVIDPVELEKVIDQADLKKVVDRAVRNKVIDLDDVKKVIDQADLKKVIYLADVKNVIDPAELKKVIDLVDLEQVIKLVESRSKDDNLAKLEFAYPVAM